MMPSLQALKAELTKRLTPAQQEYVALAEAQEREAHKQFEDSFTNGEQKHLAMIISAQIMGVLLEATLAGASEETILKTLDEIRRSQATVGEQAELLKQLGLSRSTAVA